MSEHILIGAKKAVISAACGICALPESELLKRLEELYLTGFKAAVDVTIKDHNLYHRLNEMLAILGADGQIDTRHKTVTAVMDCLHDIDGGMYEANRRAPSAEQQQQEPVAVIAVDGSDHKFNLLEETIKKLPSGTYLLYTRQQPKAQRLSQRMADAGFTPRKSPKTAGGLIREDEQPQVQITVRVKRDPVSGELLADDKSQAQSVTCGDWAGRSQYIVNVYDKAKSESNSFGEKCAGVSAIGLLREAIQQPRAQGEPVATLHSDGYWVWKGSAPPESNYAGWKMEVYAQPRAAVPDDVLAAVDRMCTPLDKSWLFGTTAEVDAKCMQIIKEFIDSIASPAQPGDWQPIETAPRDGQWFLCYVPIDGHRQFLGLYSKDGILLNEFAQPAPFPPSHWKRLDSGPKEPGEGE